MSIVRPQKLAVISGPGSEYFTGKIVKNLQRLYFQRYTRLSEAVQKKYSMTEEEVISHVSFINDCAAKKLPEANQSLAYAAPNLLVKVKYVKFKNGEVKAEIMEAVRGSHVYIVYDVSNNSEIAINDTDKVRMSVNDHLMMLFTTIQAATLAGAETVTLVLPTYPYARQHKKAGREALTAAMVARFFEGLHVKRIITLDIHSREIENAFDKIHLENLHASYQNIMQLTKIIDISSPNLTVVAPDSGAINRNKFFANTLGCPLAMLYKERDYSVVSKDAKSSNIKSIKLIGDVKGRDVIITDDMISTGGTLLHAMEELKKFGAEKIICIASLPFFDGKAPDDFDVAYKKGLFYRIVGTNAVYHGKELLDREWFVQTDVTDLFARVIMKLHHGLSISPLLDNRQFVQNLITMKKNENVDNLFTKFADDSDK